MSPLAKRSKTVFCDKKSSFLEDLPTELQHKIIGYCTDDVGNMRLVNKAWNIIVLRALETPSILPPVNLRIETFGDSVEVTVDISNGNSTCFQQLHRLVENGTIKRSDANTTTFHGIFNSSLPIPTQFIRSISRQIDTLRLVPTVDSSNEQSIRVNEILRGKKIDSLEITENCIDGDFASHLLNIVINNKVRSVDLCVGTVKIDNLGDFFISLSRYVEELSLQQKRVPSITDGSIFMFGSMESDWSSIIGNMSGGKLKKLNISNNFYTFFDMQNLKKIMKTVTSNHSNITHFGLILPANFPFDNICEFNKTAFTTKVKSNAFRESRHSQFICRTVLRITKITNNNNF